MISTVKEPCLTIEEVKVNEVIKPFIRWAGGKQNLVKKLSEHLPQSNFNNYYEPFLGAASMFFFNGFDKCVLSDINPHLINSYSAIKNSYEEIYHRLQFHKNLVSPEYYYKIRTAFNKKKEEYSLDQAANFIFLVHTSFNGIFRVNKKGDYNVPFGKIRPALPSLDHLKKVEQKLRNSEIINCMYEDVINRVTTNDFVYFDPPYPPLNETSFFQHYTIDKFPANQQEELAGYANQLSKEGVFVMISNAETDIIKKLYKGWNIKKVDAYRYVNCKSNRKIVNELIITNY